MCGIVKGTVRFGLIAALVGGGVIALVGHDRIGAALSQARADLNGRIDAEIDDAVALRAKLADLESTLPKRIAEVRSDLEQTDDQIERLEQDLAISRRVVTLADRDLGELDSLLARAERAHTEPGAGIVRVRFQDRVLSEREAFERARSIERLRELHASRTGDIEGELGYLRDQRSRLGELLDEMETEHAALQNELWQLDRQIDAIERNERLITTIEKRERRIDEHARYQSASLDEYRRTLASVRSKQEATLERLAGSRDARRYEDRARLSIERGGLDGSVLSGGARDIVGEARVIEPSGHERDRDESECDSDSADHECTETVASSGRG